MAEGWLTTPLSLSGRRVFVAGHRGMVGSAAVRRLEREGCEILTSGLTGLDFRRQAETEKWFEKYQPEFVVLAAATVGGIAANERYPADFLYDNLMIEANIIHSAHLIGVQKLLFLGSSCMYPKDSPQPILESALLSDYLEPTNEPYAVAKIAGVKLCQSYRQQHGRDFISAIPCNLYGPGDKFDAQRSHVIPALMMKAHEAKQNGEKELKVWGSGKPRREFLYVEDLADALIVLMTSYSASLPINVGAGADIEIAALAQKIARITGFEGMLVYDPQKPDGVMGKLLDSHRIRAAGWSPATDLEAGLALTYRWFTEQAGFKHAA